MISVIIPAYNLENSIEDCLLSVIKQSYSDFEIIIVDDGSTDNTLLICERMVEQFSNIKILTQKNSGVSVARNRGIQHAAGDFISFVDGDDVLYEDSLAILMNQMDDSTDIVCGCCSTLGSHKDFEDHFFKTSFTAKTLTDKAPLFYQLLNGNYGKAQDRNATAIGVPWGKLYRKSFLLNNKLEFSSSLRRMQDNMFNFKAFYFANQIKYIDVPVYKYRVDHISSYKGKSTVENWLQFLNERDCFIESHPDLITDALSLFRSYEKCVGLAISSHAIINNCNYLEAIHSFSRLRNEKVYLSEIINWKNELSLKYSVMKLLYYYRLYPFIYFMFAAYKVLFERFDNSRRF